MTGATLFSGIGAPEVALDFIDWKWCAEIEKFPSAVLKHRHSHIPNLGDVTRETFLEDASRFGPIDLICAGSPCQSFSVAGAREGMASARGNLALRLVELVDAIRPRWFLFENVPGLLSSTSHACPDAYRDFLAEGREGEFVYEADEGSDFGCFLAALSERGYSGAYASLDCQYFHLAQRRERVFVVCHLGGWTPAAAVLFDLESMSGNHAPREEAWQDFTHGLAGSLTNSGRGVERPGDSRGQDPVVAMCLNHGGQYRIDAESETLLTHSLRAEGFDASEDGTGRGIPLVAARELAGTLGQRMRGQDDSCVENLLPVAFSCKDSGNDAGELSPTLRAMPHNGSHANAGGQVAVAARARSGTQQAPTLLQKMAVRRLTVVECARLMGFPDCYLHIPWKRRKIQPDVAVYLQRHGLECWQEKGQWYTKVAPDGPMYRAFGNSMGIPVLKWIGERIKQVDEIRGRK